VTSENNNRVARRGPSWAPPAAAETQPPSTAVAPPVSPRRGAAERPALRVAEAGGRAQPPPTAAVPHEEEAAAKIGAVAPPAPPRAPLDAQQSAREVESSEFGYSTEPPRAETPAPPPGPRHHGEIGREVLRRPAKQPPRSGWRWLVWVVTFGLLNLGSPRRMCAGLSWWRG